MSLKISSALNSSDPDKESILLEAIESVNLGGYAVIDKTFDDNGNTSNEFRHFFPFPKFQLEKGDIIALITGMETTSHPAFKNTSTNKVIGIKKYFFWNSAECVWNNAGGDKASLIRYTIESQKEIPSVK